MAKISKKKVGRLKMKGAARTGMEEKGEKAKGAKNTKSF
jgi:hypothetical protein